MMKSKDRVLGWTEVIWPRPFKPEDALTLLTHIASMDRNGPLVWEVRAKNGRIHYLIGAEASTMRRLVPLFSTEIIGSRFKECKTRGSIPLVRKVKLSHPSLALNTKNTLAVIRATLASLAQTRQPGDETVLQVILGRSHTPSLLPKKLSDPSASWLDSIMGTVASATSESRASLNEKASCHGFDAVIHIGARSTSEGRAVENARALFSGLKVSESMGVHMSAAPGSGKQIDEAKTPWRFPLRLSVKELMGLLCWPLGDAELSGVPGLHPRILQPPGWYKSEDRAFGVCMDGTEKLGISPKDSLFHALLVGPTGAGKSTAILNLVMSDINAGRSVLVIDPKYDLVNDILCRIPPSRENDVVVLDPTCPMPVGLNPLVYSGKNPTLTADAVLAVFEQLFADSWGVRTQDVLSSALLTLASVKGASLVWLPALLTDDGFRHRVLKNVTDQIGLGAFWAGFDAMSPGERAQAISPVLNKLRRFLLRPELRNMLGQSEPKFALKDMFYSRKIVLVPLNKGLVGSEVARLLGSLIVGQLWNLALSRAGISPEKRHIVSVFIDEVQDYLSLPGDLSDALAQARGLGLGITAAHQYRAQLPPHIRAAFDANAHNKIAFGLGSSDARDMAQMAPELSPEDFMLLPRYHVYATLMQDGKSTGWISGKTFPAVPATRSAHEVKAISMAAYGRDAREVEAEYMRTLGFSDKSIYSAEMPDSTFQNEQIGRKKREEDKDA